MTGPTPELDAALTVAEGIFKKAPEPPPKPKDDPAVEKKAAQAPETHLDLREDFRVTSVDPGRRRNPVYLVLDPLDSDSAAWATLEYATRLHATSREVARRLMAIAATRLKRTVPVDLGSDTLIWYMLDGYIYMKHPTFHTAWGIWNHVKRSWDICPQSTVSLLESYHTLAVEREALRREVKGV